MTKKKRKIKAIEEILGTKKENFALRRYFKLKERMKNRRNNNQNNQNIEDIVSNENDLISNNEQNKQSKIYKSKIDGFRSRSVVSATSLLNPLSLFRLKKNIISIDSTNSVNVLQKKKKNLKTSDNSNDAYQLAVPNQYKSVHYGCCE